MVWRRLILLAPFLQLVLSTTRTCVACSFGLTTDFTLNRTGGACFCYALDLSKMQLKTLPQNAFSGLTNLASLNLGFNYQLTTISNDTFTGLTSLTFLGLCCNQLATIPENAFSGLTILKSLDLNIMRCYPGKYYNPNITICVGDQNFDHKTCGHAGSNNFPICQGKYQDLPFTVFFACSAFI